MISRRLLRIKVLQILYAFFTKKDISIQEAEKELYFSINKVEELFYLLLMTVSDIRFYAEKKIDLNKTKNILTEEDKNPNTRFLKNRLITQIQNNTQYKEYIINNKISWDNYPELLKNIYEKFTETEMFKKYMNQNEDSYTNDKQIIKYFYSDVLFNSEELYSTLEEKSIYWNDDIDFVINTIEISINGFKEKNSNIKFSPLYKKEDDKYFVKNLLYKTIHKHKDIEKIIREQVVNWDFDRISFIDKLILTLAISEIIEFETIPIKASFNEYIDISKNYGGKKSSVFINGVLDKVIKHMQAEKMIQKTGRGLIDKKI